MVASRSGLPLSYSSHGNTGFAGVHSGDAVRQCLAGRILEEVAFLASLNGAVNIFIAVERC